MIDPVRSADHDDTEERDAALGLALVARLHGLLRAVRLYDLSNQAVRNLLHEMIALVEGAMEDELTFVAMGQCFYLNGARVRAETAQIRMFSALSGEFDQRRLGGVRLIQGLSADELGVFLRLMVEHADAARGPQLGEAAAAAGVAHVVPITLDELESSESPGRGASGDESPDERPRAQRMFHQALRGAKAAILRTARSGRPAIGRAKRVVQPIVDSIMKNEYSLVGLTAIKNHDEYTYAHCVNVGILSIAIGHALGLPRGTLANLGVAGLLHDVGKLTIPPDVLSKPGKLTDHEWTLIRRHPLEGVKMISRMPGLSTLTIDTLNVCLYHHVHYGGGGYPRVRPVDPPPPLARIVAAADCFDAITTHRAYRARPFTGHEALSLLLGEERSHFDPAVLWALVQTVGLYPAGTLLQTRSGHMVLSINNDPNDLRRPQCRVLARPDGSHALDDHPEIWAPMPRHESVARVVPPEQFEVEIDRLLAA